MKKTNTQFKTLVLGDGFKTNTQSSDPKDFIKTLNEISPQIKGITNLGIFADIEKVSQKKALVGTAENEILQFNYGTMEVPGNELFPDNSPIDVNDYELSDLAEDSQQPEERTPVTTTGKDYTKTQISSRTRAILSTLNSYSCPPSSRCKECGGNGTCRKCGGQGQVRCSSCAGTGQNKCSKCGGGRLCISCHGSGRNSNGSMCSSCTGSGLCSNCKGSGTTTCWGCFGKGYNKCRNCAGGGKCNNCGGAGEITCSRCMGTGYYQTYRTINTTPSFKEWSFSGSTPLSSILPSATGAPVYDGTYKKWRRIGVLQFDKTNELFDVSNKAFQESPELVEEFKKALSSVKGFETPDQGEVNYKQSVSLRKVHITSIDYAIDRKKYALHILGDNHVVSYLTVPKQIQAYKEATTDSFKNKMTHYARTKAYCKLAAYIFQLDGLAPEESTLLNRVSKIGINN